ncbi:hypothetical protein NLU13_6554 [Sarocladium strictum]|uniref:RING-type domain-containing protein n=1 Tax=Sarocladium strictum TaxID=5046 RepID=A0AA39L7H9_SARSR|nr:hypothetical protein NLU13_6554 [Sarocladium strictum]
MNPSNTALGKSLQFPPTSNYPPSNQAGPATSSFESARRPAQLGQSASYSAPRKLQVSRKQHRNQRRPGFEGRANSSIDDYDAMAEQRAMRNPSGRRGQTSITHLLSYSSPRPYSDHTSFARTYRRNPTWGPGSGYHASDKARYVHANYRFVVSPDRSYSTHAADPDVHLDWTSVLQVLASSQSQEASCPICLSEPVAPRMAKCGHIFCLPCLIRFMQSNSASEDSKSVKGARWKKCPICEDTVYLHEVRPVRFYAGQESPLPRPGDDVVLRLMARKSASTTALPREGGIELLNSGGDVPWHSAANVLDYARIMKGTGSYMAEQYDEEIAALVEQERMDETLFGQDGEWTQKAIRAVNAAKEKVVTIGECDPALNATGEAVPKTDEADFYFYSAPPHLYLSPLDIRILKTKFGSFSSFPSTLLPRVEHISTGHVVDDAMRKRARYLGHLPRGCVISYLECDWTDIIPAETLEAFSKDIEKRRKYNRDKAAQEDRERFQAERLEAAALRLNAGTQRTATPIMDDEPPRMDLSEFQPLGSAHPGTSPPEDRPGFSTLADVSTSPSTQRTVWGTRVIHGSPELEASAPSGADDGWLRDEELLGTAELAMQMEAIQVLEKTAPTTEGAEASSGVKGKGKKKKQKITLMSTGGRRGN